MGGTLYSHSTDGENKKKLSEVSFKEGDIVSVEFNPLTSTLTYSNKATSFVQKTDIANPSEPIHFCAMLHLSGNDVSIL